MSGQEVSILEEFVQLIADNGIMIIISSIVVYFLAKVLNSMLKQNNQVISQILPKIDEMEDTMTDVIIKNNEADTKRNLSINKQYGEIQTSTKKITDQIKTVEQDISTINKNLEALASVIEKQHLYIDFYQDQLKEKGKD